jgi:hypothetical protein
MFSLKDNSKKRYSKFFKEKANIISILYFAIIYIIILIFLIVAVTYLVIMLMSPDKNVDQVISIGKEGIILIATISVLTFTYALASEYRERRNIIVAGKLFFKSVLNFTIGLIFLTGFSRILNNPVNMFNLPESIFNFVISIYIILFLLGLDFQRCSEKHYQATQSMYGLSKHKLYCYRFAYFPINFPKSSKENNLACFASISSTSKSTLPSIFPCTRARRIPPNSSTSRLRLK